MEEHELECPYCGEPIVLLVDWSAGSQRYVEDCEVCCRPMEVRLDTPAPGEPGSVSLERDDEA